MINASDCPTAASAGYPNSFSAAGFHEMIMPLLSTTTTASSRPAAKARRDTHDALPDAKPPCWALLSTSPSSTKANRAILPPWRRPRQAVGPLTETADTVILRGGGPTRFLSSDGLAVAGHVRGHFIDNLLDTGNSLVCGRRQPRQRRELGAQADVFAVFG